MTNLVLVRHGETTWHADDRYAGSTDIGLTPRGYEQGELLAVGSYGLSPFCYSFTSRPCFFRSPS